MMKDTENVVVTHASRSFAATLAIWRQRVSERTELASLTRAELRDAGISPDDAQQEVRKPFWQA